ncbi:MAG: T9SS type A sorting domain-containing protein [Porphyromonas sp.]|nr:T9SS type A sorting domain-containing protein [Porphyromonas sp.]
MNKCIWGLFLVLLTPFFPLAAQQEFGGKPRSFELKEKQSRAAFRYEESQVIDLPMTRNVDDLLVEDEWNAAGAQYRPYRVAVVLPFEVDFAREAEQVLLPDGSSIYRMAVRSEGAKGLNVYYDRFSIPEGGKLYIYNGDRTQLRGAFTARTHEDNSEFATSPLAGDCVVLEYEPNSKGEMPEIRISGLGHFYRGVPDFLKGAGHKDLGEDSSLPQCQINVNCPDGDAWHKQMAGVCHILLVVQKDRTEYVTFCTGSLMNNTAKDYAPLILSAAHCADAGGFAAGPEQLKKWIFSFHYVKPSCSNGTTGSAYHTKSLVGCDKLSFLPLSGMSDGLLLRLKDQVPARYRVYYNGWNRREELYKSAVGLHHPVGDAMKIATHNGSPTPHTAQIGGDIGGKNAHFRFHYDKGDTEGGSSGSPLFNEKGLLVATLTGGGPGICLPNSVDFYGRLSHHWDKYKDRGDSYQMASYLDPVGKGATEELEGTFRDGMYPINTVRRFDAVMSADRTKVVLAWQAPYGADQWGVEGLHYWLFRGDKKIADIPAKGVEVTRYQDDLATSEVTHGLLTYSIQVAYPYQDENKQTQYDLSAPVQAAVFVGELITKVTPTVTISDRKTAIVKWDAPVYYQLLSKLGLDQSYALAPFSTSYVPLLNGRIGSFTHAKYREKWPMNNPLYYEKGGLSTDPLYISQINIIPNRAGDELFVLAMTDEGLEQEEVFQRVVVPNDYQEKTWLSVPLEKPYKIDKNQMLYIGFGSENVKGKGPNTINEWVDTKGLLDYEKDFPHAYIGKFNQMGIVRPRWVTHAQVKNIMPKLSSTENTLAIQLLLSNSPKPLDKPVSQHHFGGKFAVDTPVPSAYIIKRDGQQVAVVPADQMGSGYEDKENGDPSKVYTVEVVYADLTPHLSTDRVALDAEPMVYPSTFDTYVDLRRAETVKAVKMYTMSGQLVRAWTSTPLSDRLDTADLPSGAYMVVLDTMEGQLYQKLVKK